MLKRFLKWFNTVPNACTLRTYYRLPQIDLGELSEDGVRAIFATGLAEDMVRQIVDDNSLHTLNVSVDENGIVEYELIVTVVKVERA